MKSSSEFWPNALGSQLQIQKIRWHYDQGQKRFVVDLDCSTSFEQPIDGITLVVAAMGETANEKSTRVTELRKVLPGIQSHHCYAVFPKSVFKNDERLKKVQVVAALLHR